MSSSRYLGDQTPDGMTVKQFEMPRFDEGPPPKESTKFKFQSFDGTLVEKMDHQARNYNFIKFRTGPDPEEAALTLAQAKEDSEKMLREAAEEAERLTNEAREIREKAYQEGWDQGYAEGQAKGLSEGEEKGRQAFENAAAPALTALGKIQALYDDLWETNEPALVKLASSIAEKIVHHELATSPETIQAAFKAALDRLQEQHEALFRVHPEDLSYLEAVRGELQDQLKGLVKINFETDPNLGRGDLIMETESGKLDATLRRRIEAVLSSVDEVLEGGFDLGW